MSDIAKWAILAAAVVGFVAMLISFGVVPTQSTVAHLTTSLTSLLSICGWFFLMARGFINCVLPDWAIPVFDGVFIYLILRPFITWGYRLAIKTIHYIYK